MATMGVLDEFAAYYEQHDRILAMSIATVRERFGERVDAVANEIAGFLGASGTRVADAAARYKIRNDELCGLQRDFERTGAYPASSYDEVPRLDAAAYNLGLLVSFFGTVHRFEMLDRYLRFLERGGNTTKSLLAIGYGTGYELKWARERLPDWELAAYDSSAEAKACATQLLRHFGHSAEFLRTELFPLESDEGLDRHRGRFGKVVLFELLEHLQDPVHALRNVRAVLAPGGEAFLTMAVNLAQEDHVHLCRAPEEFRTQLLESGLGIVEEHLAPVSVLNFREEDRGRMFRKGNIVCVVRAAEPG